MNNQIILIGGGGHCKSCIDVIESVRLYNIAGIVDVREKVGQTVLGYKVIGSDDDLAELTKKYHNFLITIGQIKDNKFRVNKFKELKELGAQFPSIASSSARVSRTAEVGEGTVLMHDVVVNSEAKIGKNCIINTKALLEHEVVIGDNAHVSTGAIINGQCTIGSDVFIGSGSVLLNNIEVVSNTIIGAGSVVVSSIYEPGTYAGTPIRKIK